MTVLPLSAFLVLAVAAFTAEVKCFPSSALVFPDNTNNGVTGSMTGYDRHHQFRPDWSHNPMGGMGPRRPFYPPGARPGEGPFPPGPDYQGGSRPGGFRPDRPSFPGSGDEFRPQDSRPTQPNSGFQPDFQPFSPTDAPASEGMPDLASPTATTPATVESTTKIPRRDPGYRIINTASCPCDFTRQYKPVCGTDGQTYNNVGVLLCAQKCGKDVKVYLEGSCGRNNGHPGAISLAY